MGKEHTTITRTCSVDITKIVFNLTHPRLQKDAVTHVRLAIYRGDRKSSTNRSELIRLHGAPGATSPRVATSEGFKFLTKITYTHDFCYPMEKNDTDVTIALQSVESNGTKKKTIGSFFFNVADIIHKPICKVTIVESTPSSSSKKQPAAQASTSSELCVLECEIKNVFAEETMGSPTSGSSGAGVTTPAFHEEAVLVEGQWVLSSIRRNASTIENYKELLQQKKSEFLEKLSHKKQEKVLKDRLPPQQQQQVAAAKGTSRAVTTASSPPQPGREMETSLRRRGKGVPPPLNVPPTKAGAYGSAPTTPQHFAESPTSGAVRTPQYHADPSATHGGLGVEELIPETPYTPNEGGDEDRMGGQPAPVVVTGPNFVSGVHDVAKDHLQTLMIWNPPNTADGGRVTMPSPALLGGLGFNGAIVVVGKPEFVTNVLRAYLSELETRFGEQAGGRALKLVLAGRDAAVCASLRCLAAESLRRPVARRVVTVPVYIADPRADSSLASSTSPQLGSSQNFLSESMNAATSLNGMPFSQSTELLSFLGTHWFTQLSRDDFAQPPPLPKDHLEIIVNWLGHATSCPATFPMGAVHATLAPPQTAAGVERGSPSTADNNAAIRTFAKSVVVECSSGIDVAYTAAASGTSSGDQPSAKEMRKEPVLVGIFRVPTQLLRFQQDVLKPGFRDSEGRPTPPQGALPLRMWTTRHAEKGLTLESQTHAPAMLQTSRYGTEVRRVVCSSRGQPLSVTVDGEEPFRSTSITISESEFGVHVGTI